MTNLDGHSVSRRGARPAAPAGPDAPATSAGAARPGCDPAASAEHGEQSPYTTALDALTDLVVVLRAIRSADGSIVDEEIVYANPAWRRAVLGTDETDPTGLPLLATFPLLAPRLATHVEVIESGVPLRATTDILGGDRVQEVQYVKTGDGLVVVSRDVTDRQVAEDLLRAREAELREAQSISHVGNWVWDPVTDSVTWSDELFRIYGLQPSDGAPSFAEQQSLWTDASREALNAAVTRLFETGRPYEVPVDCVRPDGEIRHAIARGAAVRGRDGSSARVHGTLADVTDAHRASEALRISEERHRLIAENALDVIWTMKPDGTISYLSPSVETLRGFSVAEAMAQTLDEILTPDSAAASTAYFVSMLGEIAAGRRPAPYRGEQEYRCQGGSTVWCDVRAYPILAPDGSLVELLGVSRDLSERKRYEDELLRARDDAEAARLALQLANADLAEAQRIARTGSWSWDPFADVVEWSEELFRIYGLEPGRPAPSFAEQQPFYTPETASHLATEVARALETGEPYETPMELTLPTGEHRHAVARAEVVCGASAAIERMRGTVTDVTDLLETKARMDLAQRAEMVGRLAGGVAHDFNNLLAAINGYAEFLADAIPAEDPMHGDVEAIQAAGARAAALTRQLLAFGRRQTLRPAVQDVGDVIAGIVPMLRSLVGDNIEVVVSAGATGRARVDRTQLEQAVINLVLNARDAMPGGGRVTVATADVAIGTDDARPHRPLAPGDFVRISVTDTGTGIAPDVLPHVFEPFFTTKALGRGTGLGLSSVEGAMEQSGGFVTAESRVGVGSVFSIFVPVATVERGTEPATPSARSTPVGGRETVLLVEDEPGVRTVTARALRELGYTAIEAGSPWAALAMIDVGATFDVLVTDVMMPGMNGRDLAARIAASRPGLPVLYVSAYSPETIFGDGLLEDGTPYLPKPFERGDLAVRLRAVLDGSPSHRR